MRLWPRLSRTTAASGRAAVRPEEAPLRSELYNLEQLTRYAGVIAAQHQVVTGGGSNRLLQRLEENERVLREFNHATLSVDQTRRVTPAAEWLLDNFYLIEEQIQMARRHLPAGYSRKLPRLVSGPYAGWLRVYAIILELIAHVDARIDLDLLTAFIAAYQKVSPLCLGELWAIPIMLRLGLIENLQRVTTGLAVSRRERDRANEWVLKLHMEAEVNPSQLVVVVAEMARAKVAMSSSFVAEFCQRLSRLDPALYLARSWIEQRASEQGLSVDQLIHQESQNQAADQVSVSNSITSLRSLSAIDWKDFVEGLSVVEKILQSDPAGVYAGMDFASRDCYRHAVESLARQSGWSEGEMAQKAIDLAAASAVEKGSPDRSAHVGFYLIEKGQSRLAQETSVHRPRRTMVERAIRRHPGLYYVGGIFLLTVLLTLAFCARLERTSMTTWMVVFAALTFMAPVSQLSVALMNWLTGLLVRPRFLPRLDYAKGIPVANGTAVVIPTLLTSPGEIDTLVESLEIHFLANRDQHLHFALLTDFRDAPAETQPGDEELLAHARSLIEKLNDKYSPEERNRFFLFHRPRRWNEGEGAWMGHERKRGKLEDFNAFLRGGEDGAFSEIVGETEVLSEVKYVITLDADTQLPRDSARQLVGTMAHPLQRPVIDPKRSFVTEGYGIMQPRLDVSLASAGKSWLARLHAGEAGIDPYTRVVSDVYQDLFDEGSFIGKGIYDVDAFTRALAGRIPENRILSHDLIESVFVRSALVSDVTFYEDQVSRYDVEIGRRQRWIRGDWQILPWLLPRAPGATGRWIANPISALSRWKIFDNLRRSVVPVALLLLQLETWFWPARGFVQFSLVPAILLLPILLSAISGIVRKPVSLPWGMHFGSLGEGILRALGQAVLSLAFLPYEAFVSLDAVSHTLVRVFLTHRHLLEWKTASDLARAERATIHRLFIKMGAAPATALIAGLFLANHTPHHLLMALPILLLWFGAPFIAWWVSRRLLAEPVTLNQAQTDFLHHAARKTWHFFETFVTAEENWLPPDNFQEVPSPTIASRTSPTNIGLSLLANLSAYDFGYLSLGRLLARTEATLTTLKKLERHQGHFFNWYDTRTLQPLYPLYVSTVDSGNLSGHLLTLASGLRDLVEQPVARPSIFRGLKDTLAVIRQLHGPAPALTTLEATLRHGELAFDGDTALLEQARRQIAEVTTLLSNSPEDLKGWGRRLAESCDEQLTELRRLAPAPHLNGVSKSQPSLQNLADTFGKSGETDAIYARELILKIETLADYCDAFAQMDFTFLFDRSRDLFSIGFNVSEARRDTGFYDLLASEARLCSYLTVAEGQVPQEHWFALGRLLVRPQGKPILVSWSGSMFEYLMPALVMPTYDGTLLQQACQSAVELQIDYGKSLDVPWGISESGYYRIDAHQNYQYRAFGVPGLGLKRGLSEDSVIAPYASALALMVAPREATENLRRLARDGCEGPYGFYEAVDYTASRLPSNESREIVRSYMSHHQGMTFLSLLSFLHGQPMQRRFMARPMLKAANLLLQERMPRTEANVLPADLELEAGRPRGVDGESGIRILTNPNSRMPEVHLLSNGNYHVTITHAGGGLSRWRDLAVTRWREDATCDPIGNFIYLRDTTSGDYWSATFQPALGSTRGYEAIFTQGKAEFRYRRSNLEVHTQIAVSPEDDVEIRRLVLANLSATPREIELTSYGEVVLAPPGADLSHPAFSNLFVQTEFIEGSSAILCSRRPRSEGERPPWLIHVLASYETGAVSCETDRAKFLGRNRTPRSPIALEKWGPLSNSAGPVLDPIISLRRVVKLPPHGTTSLDFVTGVAATREGALGLIEKYQHSRMSDRAFDLAWTHSQVTLRQLNASETDAQLYSRLAGAIVFADPDRRATPGVLLNNRRGQSGLWAYGISGDLPIVLLRVRAAKRLEIVRQMVQAHFFWRSKGLAVDLVILNEDSSVYRQSLQDAINNLIAAGAEAQLLDKPGGIFVRRLEQIPSEDRTLLESAARIVLDDEHGDLAEQLEQRSVNEPVIPALAPSRTPSTFAPSDPPQRESIFHNGIGGFTRDGHEYVITLRAGETTPAPWVNVLANPYFGTVVSEGGNGYTWFENAHEFRLTPWRNDPVEDQSGEAIYLRDEETGQYWSPTPRPALSVNPHVIRHGFGYSVFEHFENGIISELWNYVAIDAPVKFFVLKLRNTSGTNRRLSVTGYCEWVLGELRDKTLLHVQSELDLPTGALFARNSFHSEFGNCVAFLDLNEPGRTLTGDRKEFIGRNGDLVHPAALKRTRLSGKTGAGLDPCGAAQLVFSLADGEEREITFRLGAAANVEEARNLVRRFRQPDASRNALSAVHEFWNRTLGAINVDTPDPSVNVLANGWLLYQTLACRLWGRSGFYQSGGAYGFRDQLQDVMALVHAEPGLVREHLLRSAAHQFVEGDVQHWWHPPSGRGVRTHFSDDYLWLPLATCRYVTTVGDTGVLDEQAPFLEARPVMREEESYYDLPNRSQEVGTLYQHCVRAIKHGLRFGAHGLPLMGSGDWNDGMNEVGKDGRGESVWLAFFLYDVLTQFAEIARHRKDETFAEHCLAQAKLLRENIEKHGWDGAWYRRAYFDNGEPLGSITNEECQIDSIPQSWSVIGNGGDPARMRPAMEAVSQRLVRRDAGLIQLFEPPFDHSSLNPGYIKGYIPGVRENGGQYTHGAIWTIMAFALLGETERAWELFHLVSPIHHGDTAEKIQRYKVEPYVIAADVYAVPPHTGRGGWTWYTGSAGWTYRLLVETLLGVKLEGDHLRLIPRFPETWSSYKIHYRYRQTVYHITILRAASENRPRLSLDGRDLPDERLPLVDDHVEHFVDFRAG